MIERKCPHCGSWNGNEDYCKNCGEAISHEVLEKIRYEKLTQEAQNKPPDKFDLFAAKLKNHRFFLLRWVYQIGYSIGMVFAAIGAFLAWMVAMANG